MLETIQERLIEIIQSEGSDGIISSELPKRYYDSYDERLDLADEAGEKFRIKDLLCAHPNISVVMYKGVQPKYVYETIPKPSSNSSSSSNATSNEANRSPLPSNYPSPQSSPHSLTVSNTYAGPASYLQRATASLQLKANTPPPQLPLNSYNADDPASKSHISPTANMNITPLRNEALPERVSPSASSQSSIPLTPPPGLDVSTLTGVSVSSLSSAQTSSRRRGPEGPVSNTIPQPLSLG
jgi:hypothetical protein